MKDFEHTDGERRLAAIMFTDMVGFTALTQRDEALAMQLLDEQRKLVRKVLAAYNGKEIETIGDGFFVEFASSLDAVHCAVAIQSALKDWNEQHPPENRVLIRIGIHLGDVLHRGREVSGDAVNIASRIEPLAPPGGVCVTAHVYDSVLNRVDYEFETIGIPELKNVFTPIEVYCIAGYGEDASAPVRAELPKDRIAVLPFVNISPDQVDEYFADGMTEELISSVSTISGLKVIARTSVMRYKRAHKPIAQIGRELNVGSILEGSVRKVGTKIRISVQFVETSKEVPSWSHKYDREVKDVFAIQSEIAQHVAEALKDHIFGGKHREDPRTTTFSTEAYMNYLRGRQLWNKRTEDDLKKAISCFEKSISLDSNYARAYVGLADTYATLALLEFMPPNEAYPKAKEAVSKALALNAGLAAARTSLGLIKFQYDWDWKGAEEEFKEAISLNFNYAPAHHFFADYLKAMGRFEEALSEIETARELDPLSLAINIGVGHVLYLSGQHDRAIEEYKKAVELEPSFMATHIWFGRPYLEKGMFYEAISELETAVNLSGESTIALAMLGHALASSGRNARATQILEKLMEKSKSEYVPSYWIAVIYNGFRDRDQVIAWLQKAFEERSSWLVWSNVEPRFTWLRDDPDFAELMGEMRFPLKPA